MLEFVHWYNVRHRHSGIKFVTPAQRHSGEDRIIIEQRIATYKSAKKKNPERWSGNIRNWILPEKVHLNPENSDIKTKAVI